MRVTLAFCEGPHDIHFAARSLLRHSGQVRFDGPASGLPTPFGWRPEDKLDKQEGLVLAQLRRLDPLAIDLDTMNFGRKPLFEFASYEPNQGVWTLFVNMGGDSSTVGVSELINLVEIGMGRRGIDVKQVAFAFLFDADFIVDGKGQAWRVTEFRNQYAPIFGDIANVESRGWRDTGKHMVGLWLHHGDPDEGTLEDHAGSVASMDKVWEGRIVQAQQYLDTSLDKASPIRLKRDKAWKAKLTVAGQLNTATVGAGMNVVIQRGLADKGFDAPVCSMLAEFLTGAPWR